VKINSDFEIENFVLYNGKGQKLKGEVFKPAGEILGRCVLVPPFGMSSLNLTSSAYYLLRNQFEVIKFDLTSHVGESDGSIADFTLFDMASDIDLVLRTYATPQTSVVSFSLSSRAAFRVLHKHDLLGTFFLSPVVNVRETIRHVVKEDAIGAQIEGKAKDYYSVLGFDVKQEFCRDCVDSGFADLGGAIADAKDITFPAFIVIGAEDSWVDIREVALLAARLPHGRVLPISGGNHQLFRSPVMFHAFHKTLLIELTALYGQDIPVQMPDLREAVRFMSHINQLRSNKNTKDEVRL
jgi:hypothetical protein